MVTRHPDVAVVGGGIAGLTTALAVADLGASVLVMHEPRPGSASRASAGMLAAGFGFPEALQSRAIAARELYPAFLARLHDASGLDVPLDRGGIIELATTPDELARLHASPPASARPLDTPALASLEPALAGHAGGLLHPHDGAVHPARLMDALLAAVAVHPLITSRESAVTAVDASDPVAGVTTSTGTLAAAHVVLATGAWAGALLAGPAHMPVRPVRGELLVVGARPLRHVVYVAGGYLIPRDGATLVGATSDDTAFDATPTAAGRAALLDIAARAVPGLGEAMVTSHWAALRPMSPDGLPIYGRSVTHPRLWYAGGLSRNGILLAPWGASALARLLAGEEHNELDPFSPARFPAPPGRG